MRRKDLEENILKPLYQKELEVNRTKGTEYAGEEDALRNFKELAAILGLSPLHICAVYMYKHFAALMSYARRGHALSEPLESRVVDLRLYAALFLALVREKTLNEIQETDS